MIPVNIPSVDAIIHFGPPGNVLVFRFFSAVSSDELSAAGSNHGC